MYAKVYVEITNICNMHCSFCHGHSRPPHRMTREAFDHILDSLAGQTGYLYFHLMGEPLTHPQLPEFLTAASRAGFRCVITTNGTLLSRRTEELLAAHPHKISISLHSFEGDDEAACLRYLEQAADFAEKASALGTIVVFRLWNRGFDQGRNDFTLRYLQEKLPGQWAENTRGFRIRPKLFLEWGDRFAWPDPKADPTGEEVFCYGLKDHFGILCDGSVVPCCMDADGLLTLGNIFTQPLPEILSSPRAVAISEGFARRTAVEDLCRRCGYAQRF